MLFISHRLRQGSKLLIYTVSLSLALIISSIDYITGNELSFSLFYLIPLSLMAWFRRSVDALIMSVICALLWFSADRLAASNQTFSFIPVWNMGIRLGFFVIVTILLKMVRHQNDMEYRSAREIQMNLLPGRLPEVEGLAISRAFYASHIVSGDYYDIFKFDSGNISFCIADAVGHGLPASILMSNIQSAVRLLASESSSPGEICDRLNHALRKNIGPDKFITFFYANLDTARDLLHYANAGHVPPILIRKDLTFALLEAESSVLGITDEPSYRTRETPFSAGDDLVLYTDGVTELKDPDGNMLGLEVFAGFLVACKKDRTDITADSVVEELLKFGKGVWQDDVTLLILSRR
jgi:sigma-B regulation protein RsbU (phosphoserine phosphatase)